mmetsp:Transcript_44477/g.104494  ORF Transcript_44477/g.104494 Transcript_44477/m.104494 type:complete len:281 (-) Transcript_44477:61-903(-)|eukprot:938970-Rhodomonas_salina.1
MMDIDAAVHDMIITGARDHAITAAFFDDHDWMPDIPFEQNYNTIKDEWAKPDQRQISSQPSAPSHEGRDILAAPYFDVVAPSVVPSLQVGFTSSTQEIHDSSRFAAHIVHSAHYGHAHLENIDRDGKETTNDVAIVDDTTHRSSPPASSPRPSSAQPRVSSSPECMSDDSEPASQPASGGAGGARPKNKGTKKKPFYWTAEERELFMEGLQMYFQTWEQMIIASADQDQVSVGLGPGVAELISLHMGTRTVAQVRSHAQKYFLRKYREIRKARTSRIQHY